MVQNKLVLETRSNRIALDVLARLTGGVLMMVYTLANDNCDIEFLEAIHQPQTRTLLTTICSISVRDCRDWNCLLQKLCLKNEILPWWLMIDDRWSMINDRSHPLLSTPMLLWTYKHSVVEHYTHKHRLVWTYLCFWIPKVDHKRQLRFMVQGDPDDDGMRQNANPIFRSLEEPPPYFPHVSPYYSLSHAVVHMCW